MSSAKSTDKRRQFRLVIVGDGGVGKSAFAARYVKGEGDQKYDGNSRTQSHPFD